MSKSSTIEAPLTQFQLCFFIFEHSKKKIVYENYDCPFLRQPATISVPQEPGAAEPEFYLKNIFWKTKWTREKNVKKYE